MVTMLSSLKAAEYFDCSVPGIATVIPRAIFNTEIDFSRQIWSLRKGFNRDVSMGLENRERS